MLCNYAYKSVMLYLEVVLHFLKASITLGRQSAGQNFVMDVDICSDASIILPTLTPFFSMIST